MRRMSPSGAWRLGAGVVAVLLVAVAAALLLPTVTRGPVESQVESQCKVVPHKVADPSEIELGQTVRVTLTLDADCPPEMSPIDVALVIDVSASMANEGKMDNAKAAANAFLDAMDLSISRVGLVTFNHRAGVRSPLVGEEDEKRIRDAIDGLIPGGMTDISAAIDVAHELLVDSDRGEPLAMVVLTDGRNTVSGADPVPVSADRAKASGITIATVCAGGECDPDLEPAASLPELYYNVPDTSLLPELYAKLAGALQLNGIATMTVRDEIPDNMRYIEGSAVPPPARVGAAPGAYLEWDLAPLLPDNALTYVLEPQDIGTHPTNIVAIADFVDRLGLTGRAEYPIPEVLVRKPACIEQVLDVYFLIDDSNCLYGAILNDLNSLQAIRLGVEEVLDEMQLGRDRGAVIAFGDTAVLVQPLTTDRQAILDAVMQTAMRDESARLDLAYGKVRSELAGPMYRSRAQVATIFVTDGPMMPSIEMAEQQARLLRQMGVLNYGIGIGDLAQHGLLRSVCEPGGYREIDFGGDVITPYEELGQIVGAMGGICLPESKLTPGIPDATSEPAPTDTPVRPIDRLYLPRGYAND
ncbi:MAG: VWA domain-containing protein [Anaerolineae bacterium]